MIKKRNLSERHKNAIKYAVESIKNSPLSVYVQNVILFGSCARNEQKYTSDIDLLLVLKEEFSSEKERLRVPLRLIKSDVMTGELDDPDVDLKIVIGDEWENSPMLFYQLIRKEGISLWH